MEVSNVCEISVELLQMHSLVKLNVYDCPDIKDLSPIIHNLTSLKHMEIKECENLSALRDGATLETLEIQGCPILESLPEGMMQNNTTLQSLSIMHCNSLRSLPSINSLKTLLIEWCEKLELSLAEDMTQPLRFPYNVIYRN